MTAFGVGRGAGEAELGVAAPDQPLLTYVGKVLTWIPADAVVVYTAAVKALVDDPDDDPHWWLAGVCAGIAVILVVIGRLSKGFRGALTWKLAVHVVLVVIAFAIWSPTVPDSGWDEFGFIADNPGWTIVVCALAGLLFAALADQIKGWVLS
jgi:molecular chaperone DnaK (HSP70)